MRFARPLFLLAIVLLGLYLRYAYLQRTAALERSAPPRPVTLPEGVSAKHENWHYEKSAGDGPAWSVSARSFRQVKEPDRYELEKVEMKIYHKDGKVFDKVVSDRAVFDMGAGSLYSEGEANITMGVAEGKEPDPGRVVRIKSSGIRYDSKSGKVETERDVSFGLEKGEGKAVGAVYDPNSRELFLKSKSELIWTGASENPRPMKVESETVNYSERDQKVVLAPWAKLTRDNMTLDGKGATVHLTKQGIRLVETTEAKGVDRLPGRTVEYAANQLTMHLNDKSEVERVHGSGNAQLITTTDLATTVTNTNEVNMEFAATAKESTLTNVTAKGNTVVESKPTPRAGRPTPENRVLRSDVVRMKMRPDGREIDTIDTESPATLDFLPNTAGQRKRHVEGELFHIAYGRENQIDSFRVVNASTRTENEPKLGKPVPPSVTSSKELVAYFAPRTGEMSRLEQSGNFQYTQGDRSAQAERALLDSASNRITLVQNARMSDATGTTSANQIVLDQKSEDFQAEGKVQSSRSPDKTSGKGSSMLSKDEPVQATAYKMTTFDKQSQIIYDGDALLWQGASRLQASRIEIDRKNSVLRAHGKVVNHVPEQQSEAKKKKAKSAVPGVIVITAPEMVYSDKDRVAHYTGGAFLRREDMDVKADEIRAFLKEEKKDKEKKEGESSLDKATADGGVVIVQVVEGRTRRSSSEHADYFVDEAKIVLEGGEPEFEDSRDGLTRGRQLIYFANDDRLLVNGSPSKPGVSKVPRKPHANPKNKRTQ